MAFTLVTPDSLGSWSRSRASVESLLLIVEDFPPGWHLTCREESAKAEAASVPHPRRPPYTPLPYCTPKQPPRPLPVIAPQPSGPVPSLPGINVTSYWFMTYAIYTVIISRFRHMSIT
jgi:hypothetical protein